MMSRSSTFAYVALIFALAAFPPACSKDGKYFLLVDVSLDTDVPPPDSVQLTATQYGTLLKQSTVAWPSTGKLEVGLALPSDATGPVDVVGVASVNGTPVGQGTAHQESITKGQNNGPILLHLEPIAATPDAGVGDSATGGTGGSSTDASATGGAGGSDVDASTTGGTGGSSTDASATGGSDMDASTTGDAPSADAARDGEGAEIPPDGSFPDAPADTAPDSPLDGSPNDAPVADGPSDVALSPDSAGRQWSAIRNLQNNPTGQSFPTPSVAVSPTTGDAVVAWYDGTTGVQAIHYTAADDTWDTSPVTLETRGTPASVQVGVDGHGHYVVVWTQNDPTQTAASLGVWASYSSNGVNWSKPPVLLGAGPSNAAFGDVRLAVNRAGQAWVVWDQTISPVTSSADPESVYAVFLTGTAAKPAVAVIASQTNGSALGRYPRVAIDGQGNGLVVWTEPDTDPASGHDSTWAASLTDGKTPAPQLIETYDADITFGADVAMNANGQGVAVWAERANANGSTTANVFARRYSVTNGWETPAPPRLYAAVYSGSLSVDEDRYGTVDLGWSQPGTSNRYQAMFSTQAVGGSWNSSSMESDDLAARYTSSDLEPQV